VRSFHSTLGRVDLHTVQRVNFQFESLRTSIGFDRMNRVQIL